MSENSFHALAREGAGVGLSDSRSVAPTLIERHKRMVDAIFTHNGESYPLRDLDEQLDEAREYKEADRVATLEEIVRQGEVGFLDGQPLPAPNANRLKRRLLTEDDRFSSLSNYALGMHASKEERRYLVPGLQPWGTFPFLTGQPKAGKTCFVADFVAALVDPSRKFLGRFEPSTFTREEKYRGIVVINAETPPADIENELLKQLGPDHEGFVNIVHLELESIGFDLTDPAVYDHWSFKLVSCNTCGGTDDWTPSYIVVDGLTAILALSGKGPEHYGKWIAQFRRLMRELEVPNGLIVAHSTLEGGHAMGGVEAQAGSDGLWSYRMANPDNPTSQRRFSVQPRLGGAVVPPTLVRLVDGRLEADESVVRRKSDGGERSGPQEMSAETSIRANASLLLLHIELHFQDHGTWPNTRQLREMQGLSSSQIDDARDSLLKNGEVERRRKSGQGGGYEYVSLNDSMQASSEHPRQTLPQSTAPRARRR